MRRPIRKLRLINVTKVICNAHEAVKFVLVDYLATTVKMAELSLRVSLNSVNSLRLLDEYA